VALADFNFLAKSDSTQRRESGGACWDTTPHTYKGEKMRNEAKAAFSVLAMIIPALLIVGVFGQDKPAPPQKLEATELQHLRLEVKQKDTIIAYNEARAADQVFQMKRAALQAEAENVKKENHWDPKTIFNQELLTFSPAPEPKPEEKKADPKAPTPAAAAPKVAPKKP
jgi:hypothetical protein